MKERAERALGPLVCEILNEEVLHRQGLSFEMQANGSPYTYSCNYNDVPIKLQALYVFLINLLLAFGGLFGLK